MPTHEGLGPNDCDGLEADGNQQPPFVPENQKCEQLLKRNCRNHTQIDRCNPFHMIADEGLPCLPWPILPRHHVDRNRVGPGA